MERGGGGGFLHLIPTVIPREMVMTGITMSLLPWSAPSFSGVVGTTTEDSPSPALAVTFEWPMNWLRTVDAVAQFDLEYLYLRRYSADQRLATGSHAFSDVQPGGNPPDATVRTDVGRMGVESTSLTIEGRRGVHDLFMQLRRRIQTIDPTAFTKLAGHLVYVWFGNLDSTKLDKPPKRSDVGAIEALVEALIEYEPQSDQLWVPSGPIPEVAPELPLAETSAGARFYAVPLVGAAPGTILFTFAGFELGLAFTTFVTAEEAWTELQRLVDKHDQPGVDLLLITAGGPDANGNVFPVEEAVAGFVLGHPVGLARTPNHIESVVLHSWATGQATSLYPEIGPLFGPLYQSMAPIHQPLVVRPP